MPAYRRDGVLAGAALAAVVVIGLLTSGAAAFGHPIAIGVGVVGALAVEAAFLRYPDGLLPVWDRSGVAVAGATAALALGVVGAWAVPWVLGAVGWGLGTYLGLLGCVLAGLGNPVAGLVSPRN